MIISGCQDFISNDLPVLVLLGPEQGQGSRMLTRGTHAEEDSVVITIIGPLWIRCNVIRMLGRFLVAKKQVCKMVGHSNHCVGALTRMAHYSQVVMLRLNRFYGITQVLYRTNILSNAGHCAANVRRVFGRGRWRSFVGRKVV